MIIKMILALALLTGLGAIGGAIYSAGKKSERAAYAERDNAALRAAVKAKDEALARVAELEARHAADVATIEGEAHAQIEENRRKLDVALADVASGRRVLRNAAALCAASDRSTAAAAGSIAREAAEREAAELRRAYVSPFFRLAAECDDVTVERNEAVAILKKDRQ